MSVVTGALSSLEQHSSSAAPARPASALARRHHPEVYDQFASLYQQTHAALRAFIWVKFPNADPDLIEDAISDTYQRVWARWDDVNIRVADLRAYLFTVARNTMISHLRSQRQSRLVPVSREQLAELADDRALEDTTEKAATDKVLLVKILRHLPARQAQVVRLRAEGRSSAEIATIIGVSPGTVMAHLARARRTIAKSFTADESECPASPAAEQPQSATSHEGQPGEPIRTYSERQREASRLYREGRELRDQGDLEGAEACFWRADALGDQFALIEIAELRAADGDNATAERIYTRSHVAGQPAAAFKLAQLRERAGDVSGAAQLYRNAANAGDLNALTALARLHDNAGEHETAEEIAQRAAGRGSTAALSELARLREQSGDLAAAERLCRAAIEHGDGACRGRLAQLRDQAGDHAEAEAIARQAARDGDSGVLFVLAKAREFAGDLTAAEALYWEASAIEDNGASLVAIVKLRADQGDRRGAVQIARTLPGMANRTTAQLLRRLEEPGHG